MNGTGGAFPKSLSVGILLMAGALVFSVALVGADGQTGIGLLDAPVLFSLVDMRSPEITGLAQTLSLLAAPTVLPFIVVGFSFLWAGAARRLWAPALLTVAVAFAGLLSFALKALIAIPRPPFEYMLSPFETDCSFPSGHTIGIAVFLLVLGYLACSRSRRRWCGVVWAPIAAVGTALVASSRLYLGYHWLTDVVASCGLALMLLAVVIMVDRHARAFGWEARLDGLIDGGRDTHLPHGRGSSGGRVR